MKISMAIAGSGLLETYRQWLIPLFEQEHTVAPLSPKGSLEDIGDLLFSINFLPQLAQMAKAYHIPYACWIIDPLINTTLLNSDWSSEYTIMFHGSKRDMRSFKKSGYKNCYYLPLSILPHNIKKPTHKKYPISFVGNCYKPEQSQFQTYQQLLTKNNIPAEMGLNALEVYIEKMLADWNLPLHGSFLPIVEEVQPTFRQQVPVHDPAVRAYSDEQFSSYFIDMLLYHEIDMRLRQQIVNQLIPHSIHLWGDDGWTYSENQGAHYHGFANNTTMLAEILLSSEICLNIQRRISDLINMRTYEATAYGIPLLAQRSSELSDLYEPESEYISYNSSEEAFEKASYYLAHQSEAKKIGVAGQLRFEKEHTLKKRFELMKAILEQIL